MPGKLLKNEISNGWLEGRMQVWSYMSVFQPEFQVSKYKYSPVIVNSQ